MNKEPDWFWVGFQMFCGAMTAFATFYVIYELFSLVSGHMK